MRVAALVTMRYANLVANPRDTVATAPASQQDAHRDPATAPSVLLLASTRAYHTEDFVAAAARLGVPCLLATDRCHMLAELWSQGALALDFGDPEAAAETIAEAARTRPIAGIVPTDEITAVIAARAAARLGLPYNPVTATQRTANKHRLRQTLAAAGLVQPRHLACAIDADPNALEKALNRAGIAFPVVLKPLHLSGSRGVMRADNRAQLAACCVRLRALLAAPEIQAKDPDAAGQMLVESFIPGVEVAYEGLLTRGVLRTLAIFDKPDPLDGPFFAETIYVTPSQQPAAMQTAIAARVRAAAAAIGIDNGPVHAELRLAPPSWAPPVQGPQTQPEPVVIELAARMIGGLCHRILRFGAGIRLDELIIAHAMGLAMDHNSDPAAAASGVFMLPVPNAGVLRAIRGVDAARAVAGVCDVVMTARPGDLMTPLPEGDAYLGFLFATGAEPALVAQTLRTAGACIALDIAPRL